MSTKYRVCLPEQELKDGRKVKTECIVLRDVFMGDDTRKNVAVTIFSPVVVSDGYLPVEKFRKIDWDLSLDSGQVAALIEKGIIIVEDSDALIVPAVSTPSAVAGEVHASSVGVELVGRDATQGAEAKIIPGVVDVKTPFEALSHNDKIQLIKGLDVAGLNKLAKEEKLNGFFTGMVSAALKRLAQPAQVS